MFLSLKISSMFQRFRRILITSVRLSVWAKPRLIIWYALWPAQV